MKWGILQVENGDLKVAKVGDIVSKQKAEVLEIKNREIVLDDNKRIDFSGE